MKARISAVHQLEMETQWIHTDEYDEMVIPVDSIPADLSSLDVLLACMQADAGEDRLLCDSFLQCAAHRQPAVPFSHAW